MTENVEVMQEEHTYSEADKELFAKIFKEELMREQLRQLTEEYGSDSIYALLLKLHERNIDGTDSALH